MSVVLSKQQNNMPIAQQRPMIKSPSTQLNQQPNNHSKGSSIVAAHLQQSKPCSSMLSVSNHRNNNSNNQQSLANGNRGMAAGNRGITGGVVAGGGNRGIVKQRRPAAIVSKPIVSIKQPRLLIHTPNINASIAARPAALMRSSPLQHPKSNSKTQLLSANSMTKPLANNQPVGGHNQPINPNVNASPGLLHQQNSSASALMNTNSAANTTSIVPTSTNPIPSPPKMTDVLNWLKSQSGSGSSETTYEAMMDKIRLCQTSIDMMEEVSLGEVNQIRDKFRRLKQPSFQLRHSFTSQLPKFWVIVFQNHPDIGYLFNETEEEFLGYLENFQVVDDRSHEFDLLFHFRPNPFIENSFLTKTYTLSAKDGAKVGSLSSSIVWKSLDGDENEDEGGETLLDRLKREEEGAGTGGGSGNLSFFGWFLDDNNPGNDDISRILRDDLWNDPMKYYQLPTADNDNREGKEAKNDADEDDKSDADENYDEDITELE